jgi:hypothetical protein
MPEHEFDFAHDQTTHACFVAEARKHNGKKNESLLFQITRQIDKN